MPTIFFDSQTLVCAYDETCEIRSAAQPMNENNFADAALRAQVIFDQGAGGGTARLTIQGEGSNDGEHWYDIAGLVAFTVNKDVVIPTSASVTAAFLRFKATLQVEGGAAGDWVVATFDLDANLTQKNG